MHRVKFRCPKKKKRGGVAICLQEEQENAQTTQGGN